MYGRSDPGRQCAATGRVGTGKNLIGPAELLETGPTARLIPFTVDGLILAASMLTLDASRRNQPPGSHAASFQLAEFIYLIRLVHLPILHQVFA